MFRPRMPITLAWESSAPSFSPFLIGTVAPAADLHGTVVIEKKLTRRNITAPAGAYQRGVAVDLETGPKLESLAFERTHVAIYVEGPSAQAIPSNGIAASIEQTHREFQPDFVVIPAGSRISFPNFDPIFHNVFSLSKPRAFDLGNYSIGQTRMVTFMNPGIVYVNCHLHPNMAASIVVSPTRWYAKANEDGHFELADLPAGKYTLVAWHKSAGFFRQNVVVTEDRAPDVRFLIPFAETGLPAVATR
jgi:plastocyanin